MEGHTVISLFNNKLVAKIKKALTTEPVGALWMPPPSDCMRIVYDYKDPLMSSQGFHDPFICGGQCAHGWKYGYTD